MIFSTSSGKVLTTVELNERGASQLTVYAADLSNGIYRYSLIADGQLIETKQMVKQ